MNEDIQQTKMNIYVGATEFARNNNQTVGEKNDYYVTLQQLEAIILQS